MQAAIFHTISTILLPLNMCLGTILQTHLLKLLLFCVCPPKHLSYFIANLNNAVNFHLSSSTFSIRTTLFLMLCIPGQLVHRVFILSTTHMPCSNLTLQQRPRFFPMCWKIRETIPITEAKLLFDQEQQLCATLNRKQHRQQ